MQTRKVEGTCFITILCRVEYYMECFISTCAKCGIENVFYLKVKCARIFYQYIALFIPTRKFFNLSILLFLKFRKLWIIGLKISIRKRGMDSIWVTCTWTRHTSTSHLGSIASARIFCLLIAIKLGPNKYSLHRIYLEKIWFFEMYFSVLFPWFVMWIRTDQK